MVGPDMAGIAGFGPARLLQAEDVPLMAVLALANGAIGFWFAYVVATFSGKAGNISTFKGVYSIALLIRSKTTFRD